MIRDNTVSAFTRLEYQKFKGIKYFRIMSDVYEPPERVQCESHCKGMQKYNEMYNESIDDPKKFWSRVCQQFYWKSPIPEGDNKSIKY